MSTLTFYLIGLVIFAIANPILYHLEVLNFKGSLANRPVLGLIILTLIWPVVALLLSLLLVIVIVALIGIFLGKLLHELGYFKTS